MRISKAKISFLKTELVKLAPNSEVYLFGSRVDDSAKGGDIDILLLSENKLDTGSFRKVRREFFKKFGWQKIDIVNLSFSEKSTFKDITLADAIHL